MRLLPHDSVLKLTFLRRPSRALRGSAHPLNVARRFDDIPITPSSRFPSRGIDRGCSSPQTRVVKCAQALRMCRRIAIDHITRLSCVPLRSDHRSIEIRSAHQTTVVSSAQTSRPEWPITIHSSTASIKLRIWSSPQFYFLSCALLSLHVCDPNDARRSSLQGIRIRLRRLPGRSASSGQD